MSYCLQLLCHFRAAWLIALLLVFSCGGAFSFVLPDTGITTCHDESGNVIVCPRSATELYFGQDAQYGPGSMSFLPGAGSFLGTVNDQNTGLVWEQKANADGQVDSGNFGDADNLYSWDQAKSKLAELNAGGYLGYSDWRLPTAEELDHLVDLSIAAPGPMIDEVFFPNAQAANYWSADVDSENSAQAWVIDFSTSLDHLVAKGEMHHVRLVRGNLQ